MPAITIEPTTMVATPSHNFCVTLKWGILPCLFLATRISPHQQKHDRAKQGESGQ